MARANSPTHYVSIDDVADILSCNPKTVRRMISSGTLKAYKFPGVRMIRIDVRDLDRIRKPVTRISESLGGGHGEA